MEVFERPTSRGSLKDLSGPCVILAQAISAPMDRLLRAIEHRTVPFRDVLTRDSVRIRLNIASLVLTTPDVQVDPLLLEQSR